MPLRSDPSKKRARAAYARRSSGLLQTKLNDFQEHARRNHYMPRSRRSSTCGTDIRIDHSARDMPQRAVCQFFLHGPQILALRERSAQFHRRLASSAMSIPSSNKAQNSRVGEKGLRQGRKEGTNRIALSNVFRLQNFVSCRDCPLTSNNDSLTPLTRFFEGHPHLVSY